MANEFEVNNEVGKKKELKRRLIGFYPEDWKNVEKLIAMRKYGLNPTAVVRNALIHLLEKEGQK